MGFSSRLRVRKRKLYAVHGNSESFVSFSLVQFHHHLSTVLVFSPDSVVGCGTSFCNAYCGPCCIVLAIIARSSAYYSVIPAPMPPTEQDHHHNGYNIAKRNSLVESYAYSK